MSITLNGNLVALLLVGFIAGTAAATIMGERRSRTNWLRNGISGVLGALLGKALFDALDLTAHIPEALTGTITIADVLIAIVGAVILMFIARRVL